MRSQENELKGRVIELRFFEKNLDEGMSDITYDPIDVG